MVFLACFISYMLRVNISINLIAMVEPKSPSHKGRTSECIHTGNVSNETQTTTFLAPDVSDNILLLNFPQLTGDFLCEININQGGFREWKIIFTLGLGTEVILTPIANESDKYLLGISVCHVVTHFDEKFYWRLLISTRNSIEAIKIFKFIRA